MRNLPLLHFTQLLGWVCTLEGNNELGVALPARNRRCGQELDRVT